MNYLTQELSDESIISVVKYLRFTIDQLDKYKAQRKDFIEMNTIELVSQHCTEKACNLVKSNLLHTIGQSFHGVYNANDVFKIAKEIPELREYILNWNRSISLDSSGRFSLEQLKELKSIKL